MTVKIEQIEIQNAFTYRKCVVPLGDQGFVFLRGPNGSGKSTIWEILEHTFFGNTSRGLRKNGIVCTFPREDPDEETGFLSEVILTRTAEPLVGRWLVRETRDHSKHGTAVKVMKEDADGDWSLTWPGGGCPKGLDDAQKFAAQLLGLRQNEFEGCLYLSQSASHILIEGKPTEKMMYLSYLFGIDRYDSLLKELKARLKKTEETLLGTINLEGQLETLNNQLSEYPDPSSMEKTISELDEALGMAESKLKKWRTKRDDARDAIARSKQRASILSDLEKIGEIEDLGVDDDEIEDAIEEMSRSRDSLKDRARNAERREVLTEKIKGIGDLDESEYPDLPSTIESLHRERQELLDRLDKIKRREEIQAELATIQDAPAVSELTEQIQFVEKQLAVKRSKYKEKSAEYKELESQVAEFKSGMCPTCKRPMNVSEMKTRLNDLNDELHELHEGIQKPKKNLEALSETLERAQKIEKLKGKLQDLPDDDLIETKSTLKLKKAKLMELTDINDKLSQIKAIREEIDEIPADDLTAEEISNEVEMVERRLAKFQAVEKKTTQRAALTKQLDKIPEADPDKAEKDLLVAEDAYDELSNEIKEIQSNLGVEKTKQENRRSLEKEIGEINNQLDELESMRRRQQILKYATAAVPKLKRKRLHKIVCAIRDVLPRYAGTMFSHEPNTKFLVQEDENNESVDFIARRMIEVGKTMEPVLVPVKGFSGGEKQRLSVSFLFTLHSLLDPSKRPDLLILDEFDKGLDDIGIASLMALVSEVRDQYGTLIMTSHRTGISGARFDHLWSVDKDNEVSTFKSQAA